MRYNEDDYEDFDDDYEDDYEDELDDYYFSENQDKTNAALNNLVRIYLEIYDLTFNELMQLELNKKTKSDEFTKALNKLRMLKLKEQRILDNIEPYTEIEEFPMLDVFISEQAEDEEKRKHIKNRINYVFTKRDLLNNNLFEESERKEAQRRFDNIVEILLEFIHRTSKRKSKKKTIKEKYELSYLYPEVEDEMLHIGFDTKNRFSFKLKSQAQSLNMKPSDYKIEKDAFLYTYISDLINELESNLENDLTNIKLKLDIIKFGIKKIPTLDLSDLYQLCQQNLNFDNSFKLTNKETVLQRLYKILEKELIKREDYEETLQRQEELLEELEENEEMNKISQELIEIMFDLIKQINDIFDTGLELAKLESQNKDIKNQLQILELQVEREKQLISREIEKTGTTKQDIETILNDYLPIIVSIYMNTQDEDEIQKRRTLIETRIKNLIHESTFTDYSMYKSPQIPYYIRQNQLIDTFKSFEKAINNTNDKALLTIIKYEELLTNPELTDDFISEKGKIEDITTLDDYLVATITGIDVEEYRYDKDELLWETANLYLKQFAKQEQNEELEASPDNIFPLLYLQNLLKSLGTEKSQQIETDYMYMSTEFKQIVLQEKPKTKKIKPRKVRRK